MNNTLRITIIGLVIVFVVAAGILIWFLSDRFAQPVVLEPAPEVIVEQLPEEYIPQYTLDVLSDGQVIETEEERQEVFNALDALDAGAGNSSDQGGSNLVLPDVQPADSETEKQRQLELLEALSQQ